MMFFILDTTKVNQKRRNNHFILVKNQAVIHT